MESYSENEMDHNVHTDDWREELHWLLDIVGINFLLSVFFSPPSLRVIGRIEMFMNF
jgi:hypothetical protein